MKPTISILNYGLGNIYSIKNAVESLGFSVEVISSVVEIRKVNRLIIPGVGAFSDAINLLHEQGFIEEIKEFATKGKPLLGICLGMQLLFERSEEGGDNEGLALLHGSVKKFPDVKNYRTLQMQWNIVRARNDKQLFQHIPEDDYFYFLHGYYVCDIEASCLAATASYCGFDYCCAIEYKNIHGVQFHPEKSGRMGLKLLKNFCTFSA